MYKLILCMPRMLVCMVWQDAVATVVSCSVDVL